VTTATCGQCGTAVPANEITYTLVGSYCRTCHVAETADAAKLERELVRSIGIRHTVIGIVMMVLGGLVLGLGVAGGGAIIMIPTGLLIGGAIELVYGVTKLSGKL
jgi:hypothetical protein